jgi:hypothetical protein
MSKPNIESIKTRFQTNMKRLGAIANVVNSKAEGLQGVRADLLRASVVFLHVSFEDFVRSHRPKSLKRCTFNSDSDIKRALYKINADPTLFADLFVPLKQMAERRNRIVHHADLHDHPSAEVNSWAFADDWMLTHWNIAVVAFYYRLIKVKGSTGVVEDRARENIENALKKSMEFARTLLEFAGTPPERQQEGLKKLQGIANDMQEALKLEVGMFVGADGKPTV